MAMRDTSSSKQWSVMKYDLKTGLDIQKLPCTVQIALGDAERDRTGGKTLHSKAGCCEVRFEKVLCVCYVRARVIDLPDVEWFLKKRGAEFVRNHALFSGEEILIPLEYGGKVKLYNRNGGKQYCSVREVVEEFPRYVRVEKDTICASPNIPTPQIVYRGTILQLDRVTKSIQRIHGYRETFLICIDNENGREFAFRLSAPVHFTKVSDMTKTRLKDFIEHLPLPQTVEFLNINPYDVISVDDDDSQDLLLVLNGPLELLSIHMENFVVGKSECCDTNECDIIAIPAKDEILENVYVHLPIDPANESISNGCDSIDYVGLINETLYDCLQNKLYLRFISEETPLVLKHQADLQLYEIESQPDTPPLPEKSEQLKHAASAPEVQDKDEVKKRKRIFSASDIDRNTDQRNADGESRGFKSYMSQLTRRMKTAVLFFGMEPISDSGDRDLKNERHSCNDISKHGRGFVCYLDKSPSKTDNSDKTSFDMKTNCENDSVSTDGVIYASIDVIQRRKSVCMHPCSLCRTIIFNGQKKYSNK